MNRNSLLSRDDINNIILALDSTTRIFRECKLFDQNIGESYLIDPKKYIAKASGSLTDILDTTIQMPTGEKPHVFFKIWIEWDKIPEAEKQAKVSELESMYGNVFPNVLDNDYTTSLEYEARIYQYITDHIILENVSPNFVPILLNQTCSVGSIIDSITKFKSTFKADYRLRFERLDKLLIKLAYLNYKFNNNLSLRFIMTGSSPDVMSMYDFCDLLVADQNSPDFISKLKRDVLSNGLSGNLRIDEYKAILFQFFYTFYVLSKHRIMHNDNHFDNTLIQILDKPVTFEISIFGNVVKFSTQYVVKFFDWDRSYREGEMTRNELTFRSFLANSRSIAKFIPNRDFAQFLCEIRKFDVFTPFLSRLIPNFSTMKFVNQSRGEVKITNVITREFRDWVSAHPDSIFTTRRGVQYITITKRELLKIPTLNLQAIKDAIDAKFETADFFTQVKTFYFRIEGDDLIITRGWGCMPSIDELVYSIDDYFATMYLFRILVENLRVHPSAIGVYKYSIPL